MAYQTADNLGHHHHQDNTQSYDQSPVLLGQASVTTFGIRVIHSS